MDKTEAFKVKINLNEGLQNELGSEVCHCLTQVKFEPG